MTPPTQSRFNKPDLCKGCPLEHKGARFVLGSGEPITAKIAILLEAPGSTEIEFALEPGNDFFTQEECEKELAIRRRDYPNLPERFIRTGVPVVGKAGFTLFGWSLAPVGLKRKDIFFDNTLRCLPPRKGDSNYPTGPERKRAEAHCRVYDRFHLFKPDISVETLHPAAISREPTPLYLQVKDFEKARDFAKRGLKVLVLAGGKAVKWWLGYGENVTKWRGHFEWNDKAAQERRAERLLEYSQVSLEKKRAKKDKGGSKEPQDNTSPIRGGIVAEIFSGR
jgi:uracil-DNA glycosylase